MDPNATLQEIMELAALILEASDQEEVPLALPLRLDRSLAERVLALHVWLERGGFLPTAWNANRTTKGGNNEV